jgi:hypothetical protein
LKPFTVEHFAHPNYSANQRGDAKYRVSTKK